MTQVELPRHPYAPSKARTLVEEFECDLDPVGRGDAIDLMMEKPSVIKRPIVEAEKTRLIGFDEGEYLRKLR